MRRVYKNVCPATISASIMAANMCKNSLKNVESDNNKILYKTILNFFLQQNGTYFLNKPRTFGVTTCFDVCWSSYGKNILPQKQSQSVLAIMGINFGFL